MMMIWGRFVVLLLTLMMNWSVEAQRAPTLTCSRLVSGPMAPTEASLATRERLASQIHDIEVNELRVAQFVQSFSVAQGRNPSIGEVLEAIKLNHDASLAQLDRMRTGDEVLDQTITEVISAARSSWRNYDHNRQVNAVLFATPYDLHNPHHESALSYRTKLTGELGELDIMARTHGVLARGIHFAGVGTDSSMRSILGRELHLRLEERWSTVTLERIDELRVAYPAIFKTTGKDGTILTAKQTMDKALEWLGTREIDLIRDLGNNKRAWVEVKNYAHEMTLEELQGGHHGFSNSKSLYQQAQEHRDVRDFLGYTDSVELHIIFRRGITREAKEALEQLGFKVNADLIPFTVPMGWTWLLTRPLSFASHPV